jgi:hypothetical protein
VKRWLAVGAALVASAIVLTTGLGAAPPHDPVDSPNLMQFRLGTPGGHTFSPDAYDYASRPQSGPRTTDGPLLLFLPATRAKPADYRLFLRTATSVGYHVLGLDYWNRGTSVTHLCGPIPTCYTAVQQNRFDGSHPSIYSRVNPANSIVNRLHAALGYLGRHDAHGGWTRYLDGSGIRWARVVVAGHSQGGGESAYIAHSTLVHGVLMFSSPVDTFNGVPASWMGTPGRTSTSRMYAFDNEHDMYFGKIFDSWQHLGLNRHGRAMRATTPTGSHELIATNTIGDAAQSHGRTVSDQATRGSHGAPEYAPVWEWMLRQVLGTHAE